MTPLARPNSLTAVADTTGCLSSQAVVGASTVSCQEGAHATRQTFAIEGLAFPDDQYPPAEGLELPSNPCISSPILGELVLPVRGARPRARRTDATSMSMPKASMHEDNSLELREDKVRRARQIAGMTDELVSKGTDGATNAQFRSGVFLTHAGHQRGSFRIDLHAVAPHVLLQGISSGVAHTVHRPAV